MIEKNEKRDVPQFVYRHFNRELPGVLHGTFSKWGGFSTDRFAENNISYTVGDNEDDVAYNRAAIRQGFGAKVLVSMNQVHGDRIVAVDDAIEGEQEISRCDAVMTDKIGVALMVAHADCQPVLLYDPKRRAVAAVHSGWRGSVLDIAGKTVAEMGKVFSSDPADIVASIGPSLGPCCAEFVHYKTELPEEFHAFQVSENHFDFWKITAMQLERRGVKAENIACHEICTCCSDNFFSYRDAMRDAMGMTGRNGTVIMLCND